MEHRLLLRDRVVPLLRRVDWRGLGVEWAVVFGSVAREGAGRDVDILISLSGEGRGPGLLLEIAARVADALDVDPGIVDLVEAARAPCAVVRDAWRHGVLIYESRRGLARERLLSMVKVCYDYRLAAKKLRIPETAARAMRRRWS